MPLLTTILGPDFMPIKQVSGEPVDQDPQLDLDDEESLREFITNHQS